MENIFSKNPRPFYVAFRNKDLDNVPLDSIWLPVKARPEESDCQDILPAEIPIIAPHELTKYLLDTGMLKFDVDKTRQYWSHLLSRKISWVAGSGFETADAAVWWEPFALYADEAEYTVSKQKILMIFCSHFFYSV